MVTERTCVRCGRVGSQQFIAVQEGDACTAEKACRRRIQDQVFHHVSDIDDDRLFDYVRADFPQSLGTVSARGSDHSEATPRYWIGVHAWHPDARACAVVFFEEPRDTGSAARLIDDEEFEHPCFITTVVSQRWHDFDLLALTEADLVEAAQLAADNRFRNDPPRSPTEGVLWTHSWNPGEPVPPHTGTWRTTYSIDSGSISRVTHRPLAEETFYSYWQAEWNEGGVVDIEGHTKYVERYALEVTRLPIATARVELKRLLTFFGEDQRLSWLIKSLNAAAAVVVGEFEEALELYKTCHAFLADEILSLRLALGAPPKGAELAYFAMLNLKTKFRSAFPEELMATYEAAFERAQAEQGTDLLRVWAQNCSIKKWPGVWAFQAESDPLPPVYSFFRCEFAVHSVKTILKGAEEELRERLARTPLGKDLSRSTTR